MLHYNFYELSLFSCHCSSQTLFTKKRYDMIAPLIADVTTLLSTKSECPTYNLGIDAYHLDSDNLDAAVLTEFKTASVIVLEKTLFECSEVIVDHSKITHHSTCAPLHTYTPYIHSTPYIQIHVTSHLYLQYFTPHSLLI